MLEFAGKLALGRESQRIDTLVDDIDSTGIGLLALASGKLKQAGGKLAVVAGPGRVPDTLKLAQVPTVVAVRGTLAEAESALRESSPWGLLAVWEHFFCVMRD